MNTTSLPCHVSFVNNTSFHNFYELLKPSEQDKKFYQILSGLFALYFVVAVVVPLLEQAEVPRMIKTQVPVKLARIMLKEKQIPLAKKVAEKVKKKPQEKLSAEQPIKAPAVLPFKTRKQLAKKKAETSGLAAMKDELFAMREAFEIKPNNQSTLTKVQSSEVKIKRKLLAAKINKQKEKLAAVKATTLIKSDKLSTRNTQNIRLTDQEVLANTDQPANENTVAKASTASSNTVQRSEVSLRQTLEAHKARLYARYNRALRKNPFLRGKVLFEIEIQASGEVSNIAIKSSELNNPKLERQLLVIIRSITFPTENVGVVKTIWAIDFLPS
ncbi:hypothetical protein NBRC116592_23810 [Colwellia sp. KU-HH00111]|uniref:AgmX/PglI C-terminal domain-containing protein n=1 Tax=Colwellia sp. KU-HH00111 TaxID=3127652 RepID=UPI00310B49D0